MQPLRSHFPHCPKLKVGTLRQAAIVWDRKLAAHFHARRQRRDLTRFHETLTIIREKTNSRNEAFSAGTNLSGELQNIYVVTSLLARNMNYNPARSCFRAKSTAS